MDVKNDIREFVMSRGTRITPDLAELPIYGRNRRVPGPSTRTGLADTDDSCVESHIEG